MGSCGQVPGVRTGRTCAPGLVASLKRNPRRLESFEALSRRWPGLVYVWSWENERRSIAFACTQQRCERAQHLCQRVALRQAMVAGHAVLRPPDCFVILQVRKTTRLGAKPDSLRKYAGQKQ